MQVDIHRAGLVWQHPHHSPIARSLQSLGEHKGRIPRLSVTDLWTYTLLFFAADLIDTRIEYSDAQVHQEIFGDWRCILHDLHILSRLNGSCRAGQHGDTQP